MKARSLIIVVLLLTPAFALAADRPFFRKSPPRTDPSTRIPEILSIIKSDRDERKRATAIEELRQVDAKANPDIVPVLVEALLKDPRPSVRLEAAQTLGRVRPMTQAVGEALEQAAARDASRWVRLHSRTALVGYKLAGFSSAKKAEEPNGATPEKVAQPAKTPPPPATSSYPAPKIIDRPPVTATTPPTTPNVPQPLPASPSWSTAVPVPPIPATPPPSVLGEGPVLAPPR